MKLRYRCAFLLLLLLAACGGNNPGRIYEIYPDTGSAPRLHYYGPDPQTASIKEIGAFAGWEGGGGNAFKAGREPATEIEIHTLGPELAQLRAPCEGVLVYLNRENDDGDVSIRYGRNYIVSYRHVAEIPAGLSEGQRLRQGDLLGRMIASSSWNGGFWELELEKLYPSSSEFGGRPLLVSVYPLPFFDDESKTALQQIRQAAETPGGWIVDENDPGAGWLAYVPSHEMWADSHKVKLDREFALPFVGLEDYLAHYHLSWILSGN